METENQKQSLRVLIVEDEPEDAALVVDALQDLGWKLEWKRVQSAPTTLTALSEGPWDVVIADYNLPYFSGLEALALVRRRDADLPVIVVSRKLDEDAGVTTLHLGATDYVMKHNLARLGPAVQRALREREERSIRRQAEEALRRSEERYRELVENANDVVLTIDLEGNLTSFNRAGELITGYKRDELLQMSLAQILTPESYELTRRMLQRKLDDGVPTRYELDITARDGRCVPLEVSSRLILQEGVPVGVQAIARDITDRRQAERELWAREQKQATVAELGRRALLSTDLDAVFQDAATCVAQTLGVDFSSILELLPDGKRLLGRAGVGWRPGLMGQATVSAGPGSQAGYALLSHEPVVMQDVRHETRFAIPPILSEHQVVSGMSVIIHGRRRPFGALCAFTRTLRSFGKDDVLFLQAVANVLAAAVERKRLEEERAKHAKELTTRVLQAQEEERKRIARELHDETAQTLSVLLANLDLLERHLPSDDDRLLTGFQRVRSLARRALDETRALSHDLRPTILDDVGLVAALEWLAAEHEQTYGGAVSCQAEPVPGGRLSPELEVTLFRIAQEALTNSGKHAAAATVHLCLSFPGPNAILVIEDDGRGFDADRVPRPTREGRLGLYGMRERTALLGGSLHIESQPGKGTRISATIPLAQPADATREAPLATPRAG